MDAFGVRFGAPVDSARLWTRRPPGASPPYDFPARLALEHVRGFDGYVQDRREEPEDHRHDAGHGQADPK